MTPEEQAQARDAHEEMARHVMDLAATDHEKGTEAAEAALEFAAKAMALAILLAILLSLRRKPAADEPAADERMTPTDAEVDARATRIVSDARAWTEGHAETLRRKAETRDEPEPPDTTPLGTEDPWRRQASRTLATRHQAEAVIQIGTEVDSTLRKVWISRADSDVRGLHRKLHGNHAELNSDFWRWPASGRSLGFPGDPRAPLDQIINCRCILILAPASQALDISPAFQPADFGEDSFPLAASVPAQRAGWKRQRVPDAMALALPPLPPTRKAT